MGNPIYPNPANNLITVELSNNEKATIQIFNSLGIVVKETEIDQSTQIDAGGTRI